MAIIEQRRMDYEDALRYYLAFLKQESLRDEWYAHLVMAWDMALSESKSVRLDEFLGGRDDLMGGCDDLVTTLEDESEPV